MVREIVLPQHAVSGSQVGPYPATGILSIRDRYSAGVTRQKSRPVGPTDDDKFGALRLDRLRKIPVGRELESAKLNHAG